MYQIATTIHLWLLSFYFAELSLAIRQTFQCRQMQRMEISNILHTTWKIQLKPYPHVGCACIIRFECALEWENFLWDFFFFYASLRMCTVHGLDEVTLMQFYHAFSLILESNAAHVFLIAVDSYWNKLGKIGIWIFMFVFMIKMKTPIMSEEFCEFFVFQWTL